MTPAPLSRCVVFGAVLLAWPGTGRADAIPPLTLDQALAMAWRDNPQLTERRLRALAMRERVDGAEALPNPMATYSGMDKPGGGSWPDTGEKRFMLSQDLPGFGKRALRGSIARSAAEAMREDLEAMAREVTMKVKEAYAELRAVQQAIAVTRGDDAVLRRMADLAESLYTTGQRTQQDVLKARAERTMLTQRLLELDARATSLKARLNTLFNRRPDAPLGDAVSAAAIPASRPLDAWVALAASNRPDVKAARLQVERYALETRLMRREAQPDYRVGVEYRDIGGADDMLMVTLGIDLPIWRSRIQAGIREAGQMQAAGEAARVAAERQSALDVQEAVTALQTATALLALYRSDLLPQAEARFNASEAGYQAGKTDFMDLLESQRFLLNARVMAAMTEGEAGMQAARLEWATATAPVATEDPTHDAAH